MRNTTSGRMHRAARLAVFVGFGLALSAQEVPVAPPALPRQEPNTAATPSDRSNTSVKPEDRRTAGAGVPATPGAPVNSSSYKIGAADVLNVQVWDETRFSGQQIVHEDGMFTLPLVGDLKAGGMTPVQVEEEITKALTKYVRNPLVTVTVQQVGSKQYYIDGEINRPGEYPLVMPTTILEAMSKAGGPQAFANTKKVYVLRGSRRIPFNYRDVLRGKHMDQNIHLEPGDHIVVP